LVVSPAPIFFLGGLNAMISRFQQAFPYLFMVNNAPQDVFMGMHAFINLFCAANKVGKTAVGVVKFIKAMKTEKIRARIASDPTLIQTTVVPEILKWLGDEKGKWEIRKNDKNFESTFRAPNGSFADILTYDQKPKEFEGVPLNYLWLDEPPPHSIWGACLSRFLHGGSGEINLTMTPLFGSAYIYDEVIAKADKEGKYAKYLYADIEEACLEHGKNGWIPHARIEQIISGYDQDEKEARAHGKFGFLVGLVYKELHPKQYIAPVEVPADSVFYTIVDPHDRRYPAISLGMVTPREDFHVVDEYPNENYETLKRCPFTIAEISQVIKSKETISKDKRLYRIMDPNFGASIRQNTGRTIQNEYSLNGIPCFLGNDDMILGHNSVKELIKRDGLYIWHTARNHWHFMTRYSYLDKRTKAAEHKALSEEVNEKFKDFCDNIRYWSLGYAAVRAQDKKSEETHKDEHMAGHMKGHEDIYAKRTQRNPLVDQESDIRNLV
jgi:phage terminase large subunit-like protein